MNYFEHHTYLLDTNTEAMVQEFPEEIQHLFILYSLERLQKQS